MRTGNKTATKLTKSQAGIQLQRTGAGFFFVCHTKSSEKFWCIIYLTEEVLAQACPTYTVQLFVTLETIELQVASLSIQDQSFGSRINH